MAVCNVCALDKGVCSMIEMKDVSFCYAQSDMESLCGVNLSIADGECILLCGKSGCGKTTMTRLINGMIPDFYDGELKGRFWSMESIRLAALCMKFQIWLELCSRTHAHSFTR